MQLLPNEKQLVSSNENKIVLTDQRIHMTDKVWGKSYKITIFLEDISSVENIYKSNMVFLIISAFAFAVGLFNIGNRYNENPTFAGFSVGIVFLILWAASRKHIVTVCSKGGHHLNFSVEGMGESMVEDFVYKLQMAKGNRMNQLIKR